MCVKPGFDEDKLKSYGYSSGDMPPFYAYYYGFSTYQNVSMVGWGGLNAPGDALDPAGMLYILRINSDHALLFRSVQCKYESEEVIRCVSWYN